MQLPALYAILNLDDFDSPETYLKELLLAGCDLLQLRSKNKTAKQLLETCTKLVELSRTCSPKTVIIINDDPTLAINCGADGVHLGQEDCSVSEARKIVGPNKMVGLSTHNLDQVRQSTREPVNYIGFGPVFHSTTKNGHAPETGLKTLAEVAAIATVPVVAIGGFDESNIELAYQNGASSCAVISALAKCNNKLLFFRNCAAYRAAYAAPSASVLASPSTPS